MEIKDLNIYEYTDPGRFLSDVLKYRQRRNSRFTLRAWCQQMGIKHHSQVHQMLKGKRFISKTFSATVSRNLSLDFNESNYFEALIDLQRVKSDEDNKFHLERLRSIAPKPQANIVELESFHYLENPLHGFIAELSLMKDFNPDIYWIKEKLRNKYSLEDIDEALRRLKRFNVLVEDKKGNLKKVERHIASKSDVSDRAVKNYQQHVISMAKEAVVEQGVLEREYQGVAFNFPVSRMGEIKEDLRRSLREIIAKYESFNAQDEELYQLNIQFFGISSSQKKNVSETA